MDGVCWQLSHLRTMESASKQDEQLQVQLQDPSMASPVSPAAALEVQNLSGRKNGLGFPWPGQCVILQVTFLSSLVIYFIFHRNFILITSGRNQTLEIVISWFVAFLAACGLTVALLITCSDPRDPMIPNKKPRKPWFRNTIRPAESDLEQQPAIKHCSICQSNVSAQSLHCRFCGKCIPRLDHHCFFLNTCIGRENYPYFFVVLCVGVVMFSLDAVIGWFVVAAYFSPTSSVYTDSIYDAFGTETNQLRIFMLVLTLVISVTETVMVMFLGDLIRFHIKLWRKKMTTLEYSRWAKNEARDREASRIRQQWSRGNIPATSPTSTTSETAKSPEAQEDTQLLSMPPNKA